MSLYGTQTALTLIIPYQLAHFSWNLGFLSPFIMLGSSTAAVAVLILTGIAGASSQGYKLDVQLVARNLGSPIDLFTIPEDTSGTRYILEQDGRVLILEADNSINPLFPFLNIKDRVVSLQYAFDERGLIAVAFHPNYKENGKLYARYTANRTKANMCVDADGNTPTSPDGCPGQHSSRLSEFTVSQDNPRLVNHTSEKILMAYENPTGKNIGAGLAFGPGELSNTLSASQCTRTRVLAGVDTRKLTLCLFLVALDGLLYTGYGDGGKSFPNLR